MVPGDGPGLRLLCGLPVEFEMWRLRDAMLAMAAMLSGWAD